jgi:isoleucyl-tRNA synthetase
MTTFKRVETMNLPQIEMGILNFWKENDIYGKTLEAREGAPKFVFYEGPPTANGKPHPGHVLTRVMKDLIPRYKTMCGYYVYRKGGWDTHGLPVELEVEKFLGISGKRQIEDFGVENFIKKCKESVFTYKKEWEKMTERVGFWIDLDNAYVTYTNEYIESVWWALKQIWDKDLLYKGHKVVPYCSRCGTSLSSHEVAQGYADVKDPSIYVKMKVSGKDNTYFLVWTTTPWTLPANAGLAVGPGYEYAVVKIGEDKLILAKELVPAVLEEDDYQLEDTVKGSKLVGLEYEPIFPYYLEEKGRAFKVVAADFVTLTDGTGIVHIAPAFGEDDYLVGQEHGFPVLQPVGADGKFVEPVKEWEGLFVKEADPLIIEDLNKRDILFKKADYEHSYPFCWRCDTPLLYYARTAWFIKTTAVRDKLLENNQTINWCPEHIKDGRFGKFLENVIDWNLSRERYWGTPLPIWVCEDGHQHCIGSVEELRKLGKDVPSDLELHKPYIDEVILTCPECGKDMKRIPEVIDCWFDAGSMPFAQWHYPFENKEIFEENFPANFISEAIDQTRGWFYTLLVISTILFDRSSYENCLVLGHVLDEVGVKMSKHKGNVVDPWNIFDTYGADPLRWYLYTVNSPWAPTRFYEGAAEETLRRFFGTLWNVYSFYVLYANVDDFDPTKYQSDEESRPLIDKWLLSKLNHLIKSVRENLNAYEVTSAARAIEEFVDELSNWYVRRNRRRYWGSEMTEDKIAAFLTLYETLTTLTRLLAPFTPFISEELYQNLVRSVDKGAPVSVHLTEYPVVNEALLDYDLERRMDNTKNVVYLGRAARARANIKNRQPLSKLLIYASSDQEFRDVQSLADLVKDELNIKEIEAVDEADNLISYTIKPRFDILGPKYGKSMKGIASALGKVDANQVAKVLKAQGSLTLDVAGNDITLTAEEILLEAHEREGYVVETDAGFTVALDTTLTHELVLEGLAREMVNKVQTMRKEAGFEIEDRIETYYESTQLVKDMITRFGEYVMNETLSLKLEEGAGPCGTYTKEWDLNGESARFSIIKTSR